MLNENNDCARENNCYLILSQELNVIILLILYYTDQHWREYIITIVCLATLRAFSRSARAF